MLSQAKGQKEFDRWNRKVKSGNEKDKRKVRGWITR